MALTTMQVDFKKLIKLITYKNFSRNYLISQFKNLKLVVLKNGVTTVLTYSQQVNF